MPKKGEEQNSWKVVITNVNKVNMNRNMVHGCRHMIDMKDIADTIHMWDGFCRG